MLGHVVRDVFTVSCRGTCLGGVDTQSVSVRGRLTVSLSPQASFTSAHTVSTSVW